MIIDESGQLSGVISLFHYLICLVDGVIQDTAKPAGIALQLAEHNPLTSSLISERSPRDPTITRMDSIMRALKTSKRRITQQVKVATGGGYLGKNHMQDSRI